MRSEGLAQLFGAIGVVRSFSRPHVSDDNAFSESQFKTLKYQPDYPERFTSLVHARAWCQEFFAWYNDHHQHSGLALFTPAEVFYGRVEEVAARRQAALDHAYAQHPSALERTRPPCAPPPSPLSVDDDAPDPATTTITAATLQATGPETAPASGAVPLLPRPPKHTLRNASRSAIPS